jgi:hypothetical protein
MKNPLPDKEEGSFHFTPLFEIFGNDIIFVDLNILDKIILALVWIDSYIIEHESLIRKD